MTDEPRDASPESFVMVAVPSARVLEVYSLLASDQSLRADGLLNEWSTSDLRRLRLEVQSPLTQAVLAYLSGHAEEWISTTVLLRDLKVREQELKAALSGFTRTLKARFGRSDWPFAVRASRIGGAMVTEYQMASTVAERLPVWSGADVAPSKKLRPKSR